MIAGIDAENLLVAVPFFAFFVWLMWDMRRKDKRFAPPTYYSGGCVLHLRDGIRNTGWSIVFEDVDTGRFYRREPCVGFLDGEEVQVIVEPSNIAAIEVTVD